MKSAFFSFFLNQLCTLFTYFAYILLSFILYSLVFVVRTFFFFPVSDAACVGHGENDVLEFTNFLGTGDTYTNVEFYKFINPWEETLPYIYDRYDYEYCAESGVDFLSSETSATPLDEQKSHHSDSETAHSNKDKSSSLAAGMGRRVLKNQRGIRFRQ
jgi:hypothetical protein